MKKILISILIVLLLILTYVVVYKGINIGFVKIDSIKNIKTESDKLDENLNNANELSNTTYPAEVEELEQAIKQLKITKQEYENKNLYNTEDNAIETVTVKTYKIHYLWTILGNYRKDRGVQSLNLDLKSTEAEDVYDLEFTVVGLYTNIVDFLYDIENDEELNFTFENLKMQPYTIKTTTTTTVTSEGKAENKTTEVENPYNKITETTTTETITQSNKGEDGDNTNKEQDSDNTTNKTTTYDPKWVETTFTVKDIGITLD